MHISAPLLALLLASASGVLALPKIIAAPSLTPTLTPAATCTTTLALHPTTHHDKDPTSTTYRKTITVTKKVPCGGCELATREMGHGPVVRYVATVTKFATVSTETVCARSTH